MLEGQHRGAGPDADADLALDVDGWVCTVASGRWWAACSLLFLPLVAALVDLAGLAHLALVPALVRRAGLACLTLVA